MANSDVFVLAQRLHLNGKLYEIGEQIAATVFEERNAVTGLLHIFPETVEQCVERLRAAGVLKLPLEIQQASDVQATLAAKEAEIAALQAQLAEMQQQAQAATLPASAPAKKSATSKGADMAPAAESAPLAE